MSINFWKDQLQFHSSQLIEQARSLPPPAEDLYDCLQPSTGYSRELFHFDRRIKGSHPIEIQKHLKTIHVSLHLYLQALQKDFLPPYRRHLQRLSAGEISPEEAIADKRDEIQSGFCAIGPLLTECKKLERLQRIFSKNFCSDCFCLFEELQQHHDCVTLQGLLGEQLPFKLLLDLATNRIVDATPLESFINQLYKNRVPVAIIHRALKAIVETQKTESLLQPDVGYLESLLQDLWEEMREENDWGLFDDIDPATVAENRLLKPGDVVTSLEGKLLHSFTLGKEIGVLSKNRFFTIPDCENIVIWFPPNIALPGLMRSRARQQIAETRSHCLPLNCPSFVDAQGRFCIVEKLHTQLGGPDWEDQFLTPIIAWLKWLREIEKTPSNFRPEYIHFNSDGKLTSVKEMRPLPYHAGAMEAFVKKIAKDDTSLLKRLLASAFS